jgi:hypothetical protein
MLVAAQPNDGPQPAPAVLRLGRHAYHGLAGRFVEIFGPHTEADPVALLAQFLTAFGNCVGRAPHLMIDGARHGLGLFVVLVGVTSKGRKGTSEKRVRAPFVRVDPIWAENCIMGGIVSGEGLIYHLRDPIKRVEPIKQKGRFTEEFQEFIADPGVSDKRALVIESEFSALLKACERLANTGSEIIRRAWDGDVLRTMAKNSPNRATDPHVSIVGHITGDELKRTLNSTAQANGFANRFLWFEVKRSKELPFPTEPRERDVENLIVAIRDAVDAVRRCGQMKFSDDARQIWAELYHDISAERPGMLGAVTGRAEAQVMRLAAVYAALDGTHVIATAHLFAAMAVWTYSLKSAESIFRDALGDVDADAILSALRSQPAGLTRTEINALFARNLSASRIERALTTLLRNNLVEFQQQKTAGRPIERWSAVKKLNEQVEV